MSYTAIQIWGDSVALGATLDERRGRLRLSPERADERLRAALDVPVVNRAVIGATAPDGLRRFEAEAPAPGAVVAIEYGGNDCDLDWPRVADEPEKPIAAKVPLERYKEGLARFVRLARERGMRPLLVTPPPIDAARFFRWATRGLNAARVLRALGDAQHIYRWQERYAIAMRDVAAREGCPVLDARDAFLSRDGMPALISGDGIHPSDAGHRVLAEAALAAAADAR